MSSTPELSTLERDGATLRVYRWTKARARGLIHINHGMAEHAARYQPLAEAMLDAGWAVVAHDHRGHGETVELSEDGTLGHFADDDGWARVIDDARAVRRAARADFRDGPLIVFGHSMGSFIALSDQVRAPGTCDGLILSGSDSGQRPLLIAGSVAARVERRRLGKRGQSPVLAAMSFGSFNKKFEPARTEFDWLSRDRDEVDRYIADPLCGTPSSAQLWIDLVAALLELRDDAWLRRLPASLPIYNFAGEDDPVSRGGVGVRTLSERLQAAGIEAVTTELFPEARHECLNETNRDEVIAKIVAWCEERLP